MDSLPVSVVVVSRDRPDALMRCLNGLAQLDYPEFEIICVACPAGSAALAGRPDNAHIKAVAFDEPNISAARNLGIAQAAGEVVAFIDDDAVPEPLWLHHLVAPFAEPDVAATGGYVIGRNGISFQWTARSTDRTGEAMPLDVKGDQPVVLRPQPDRAIKTEGTNMAVRRDILAEMGGFDPAFRFYLDETDVNQRLAELGHATALVPLARVHHGFEPSVRRKSDRTPRDLFEIGASKAIFLRKYCSPAQHKPALDAFLGAQEKRLLRFMQSGHLDPEDVLRLKRGLKQGFLEGQSREIANLAHLPRAAEGVKTYPGRYGAARRFLAGRVWQRGKLYAEAHKFCERGEIVTVLTMSPTNLYHKVNFSDDGVWTQAGGLFGKSERSMPFWSFWRFPRRVEHEKCQVAQTRGQ